MSQSLLLPTLAGVAAGLAVVLVVLLLQRRSQQRVASGVLATAQREAAKVRSDAAREAERQRADGVREMEAAKAESVLAAKMETLRLREELDRELQRKRDEWERVERRAEERSRGQDRKVEEMNARERSLDKREETLGQRELALRAREGEADKLAQEQRARLERIAGLTAEDARREILQRVEDEARGQAAALARDVKEQARKGADREARRIIAIAIQRLAAEHTAESTVAAVPLPNDEMKGRIIGREGRNIRAFETATGVDVIIDDTPDTVIVSCFDPVRREVARRALEALIQDGRIHPGRIEEVVVKAQKELEAQLVELGEQAAYDTGIHGLHPELVKLIGRMRYRTLLRPEHLRSLEGSGLAGRDDGGGAAPRRRAGQARRPAARRGQGADPRATRAPTSSWASRWPRRYGESRGGHQLHPGPPRRRAARVGGVGAGAGRRRDQRLAPGRAPRGVRDLREAPRPGWRRSPTSSPGWRSAT